MENVVGPSGGRCQTSVSGQPTNVNADGGTVAVTVTAARDCTWTASSESPWMQLSATSGQGDASLSVTVAANQLPNTRSGAVVVNDQRLTVSQEARPCTFDIQGSSARMSSDGGRGSFGVTTVSGCTWAASTSAPWIRMLNGSGNGAGTVEYEVLPNPGSGRTAVITVAERQHTVTQVGAGEPAPVPPLGPNCAASVNPTSVNVPVGGGPGSVALTINGACDWTASSNEPWVTFTTPTTGRGNATVGLQVAANTGAARAATVTIAQQIVVVAQPAVAATPTCTYSIAPSSRVVGAPSGTTQFTISTSEGCRWTASVDVNWISLARTSGSGPDEVRYTFQTNTGPSRTGTITVEGRTLTVRQEAPAPPPPCTYSLAPTTQNVGAANSSQRFTITTNRNDCQWTASSDSVWVRLNRTSGNGTSTVDYSVDTNTATSARTGTITAQNQTLRVSQDAAAPPPPPVCNYAVTPPARNVGAAASSNTFTITTGPECAWTASVDNGWVSLSATSGTGTANVSYSFEANSGTTSRTATITAQGQTHVVTQEGAAPVCSFSIQPPGRDFPANGGSGTFSIVTNPGCQWEARSNDVWVVLATTSGSGPANDISYSVQQNGTSGTRSTTIRVNNGPTHAVTQQAPAPSCTFAVDPPSQGFTAGGGQGRFNVVTQPGCQWSASTAGIGWASITSGGSGVGPGPVEYRVDANAVTAPRSGQITVNNAAHSVNQEAAAPPPPPPCTFQLTPSSLNFPANGGPGQFTVETQAHCQWSPSGAPEWVTSVTGGQTGSGPVTYTVQPNTAQSPRSGSITVNGQAHSISQDPMPAPPPPQLCTYSIDPTERNVDDDGTLGIVRVETGDDCTWSVSPGADWLRFATSGGRGRGGVGYGVEPNRSGASRMTSATIAGHTFTVRQQQN